MGEAERIAEYNRRETQLKDEYNKKEREHNSRESAMKDEFCREQFNLKEECDRKEREFNEKEKLLTERFDLKIAQVEKQCVTMRDEFEMKRFVAIHCGRQKQHVLFLDKVLAERVNGFVRHYFGKGYGARLRRIPLNLLRVLANEAD